MKDQEHKSKAILGTERIKLKKPDNNENRVTEGHNNTTTTSNQQRNRGPQQHNTGNKGTEEQRNKGTEEQRNKGTEE